jgi:hypothetical protein
LTHPNRYNKSCFNVIEKTIHDLSEKEWTEFNELVKISEFWYLSYNSKRTIDGSTWKLSGLERKTYETSFHEISRASPPKGNNFRDIGEFMIEKSQIDIGKIF